MGSALTELVPFRIPLRQSFRRVAERSGVLLHGPAGWGEFSPFPDYGPAQAARWLAAAREAALDGFPPPVRSRVEVNATVPAIAPAAAASIVVNSGCRTIKVKVAESGQDLAADVERVAAVRDAAGPDGRIRVDVNGAWDVETAVLAISRLDAAAGGLEYVEQPCATLEELADVRGRVTVPVAADESIRLAGDAIAAARRAAVDVIVLKVQPLGGVRACLDVAEAADIPVVVSSAVETSVGLAAGLALAAALPALDHACGLGTAWLLTGDVTDDPLIPAQGFLDVRTITPSRSLLDTWTPAPEIATELLDRLATADRARIDA
ncbi:MAG: o-succinylbenzoate synthase [Nitriliruptorales bacterium]|nr:o-succinylbenzoate synthase [Nitriliruptorales bacterium]